MPKTVSKLSWFATALLLVTAAGGVSIEKVAWSGEVSPYSAKRLENAKAEGKTVLLDFHASWCPTCRRQKSSLEEILKEKNFSTIVALEVDYDNETKLEKDLRVSSQSTLILFKGGKEIARSISLTSPDELRTFLSKAAQE